MRIAYISESAIPSRTANSIHVMKMCQALAQEGHEVILLASAYCREPREETLSLWHHYGVRPLFSVKRIWTPVPEPLGKYVYGLVAAAGCRYWFRSKLVYARQLPGAVVAALLGCRVLFEVHDAPSSYGRFGFTFFEFLLRQRGLERVVVISYALKDFLFAAWPHLLNASKVMVAPDGVDLERFRGLPGPIEARARLGISEAFVAGYAGHLYPGRGIDVITELARRLPEVHFLIVGGNPEDVETLRQVVKGNELANVTLTGFIPNADLALYLAACDVLLMPHQRRVTIAGGGGDISRWMSPMKMFEYLATGRPILASDLPVLREVLNEENAVLLEPTDIAAWQRALQRVSKDDELRERLGTRARKDAERYTWRQRASNCVDLPPELRSRSRARLVDLTRLASRRRRSRLASSTPPRR